MDGIKMTPLVRGLVIVLVPAIEVKSDLAELGRFSRPFTHDPN